jgi:hypothetical protein
LLIEESRTNITFQSEDFTNSVWTSFSIGATITGNATTAPSGAVTADKLIMNNGVTTTYLRQTTTVSANIYTFSIYAKAAEFNTISIQLGNLWSPAPQGTFNVATGVITASSNCTASITPVGNGWYRCIIVSTVIPTSGNTGRTFIYAGNNGNIGVTGDGVSGVYIWGAQVELGAFATSYIPTTTTALTRNADVATMTGTNFSNWFNASEGTFVSQCQTFSPYIVGGGNTSIHCTGASDALLMSINSGTLNSGYNVLLVSGADSGTYRPALTPNALAKAAFGWKTNTGTRFGFNGATEPKSSGGTAAVNPSLTALRIGSRTTGIQYMNGWVSKLNFYSQLLTQSEMNAFTK